ncbi:DUF7059 domain-containing protein [Pseudoclavibacter endophyticus]|uniref:DUF7059 domain-containing protein n=1 Tax=Pseudoclavibacter endophyticus TaxID=1778590 RepID=UPI001CE4495E|nr:methyltransferase [Pseudoclavibacter endophyticus]
MISANNAAPASAPAFDDPADAPDSSDLDRLARIRDALAAAEYTVDGVERFLGADASAALHRDLLVPASLRAAEGAASEPALAALVRLFLLAEPVERSLVPAAGDLVAARFAAEADVAAGGDEDAATHLVALVDVRPYATDGGLDTWICSDLGGVQLGAQSGAGVRQPLRRDHVVGIGPATTNLAQLTPRDEIDRALDLGVGMGVQALHLLAHAKFVVATDISARALAFARVNLLLAAPALGIDPARLDERVSLRLGNLLAPVAGERFDLVVSNPPFVITPRTAGEGASDQYTYRDGGRPGDAIIEGLVRGIGDVLAPGGVAVMLGNWEVHEGDETWHTRLERWPAADVDLWVVQRERATPIEYADMWLRDAAENAELVSWREAFVAYLADFAGRSVDEVGMGMLVLRRRADDADAAGAAPLRRFEGLTHQLEQPLGERVRRTLDRVTWLRGLADDAALWDETLVVAGDISEERHSRPGDEHPSAILLRQGGGYRRTYPCSTELAGFVSVCDGDLAGGQIVAALAELLGVDAVGLGEQLAPQVRDLVELGFLEPVWV